MRVFGIIAITACLASGLEAQAPSVAQVERVLEERPDLVGQLRQRIAASGLTAEQIRNRLAAAGYPASLLDPYLSNQVITGSPDQRVFQAVRELGLAGEAEAQMLENLAAVANRMAPVPAVSQESPSVVFGLDMFRRSTSEFQPTLGGPVDPTYKLGPGDLLVLVLTGDVELSHTLEVNREGFFVIPQVGQLFVNGLTLDALRSLLYTRLGRVYSGVRRGPRATTTFQVSVARLRTNQVFVVGDVARPGSYLISGAGTVLTALYAAGGPTENGSLRSIEVRRGGTVVDSLDLYDYLLQGDNSRDIRLETGDLVFVPVRGVHVQIGGEVLRPRIYELSPVETLRDLLTFSGGFRASALRRIQIDRVLPPASRQPGGRDRVVLEVPPEEFARGVVPAFPLEADDEVTVFAVTGRRRGFVTVRGNVWTEGRVGYSTSMRLSDALRVAGGSKPDTYLGQILVSRLNPDSTRSQLRSAFQDSTGAVSDDLPLMEDDEITVFSRTTFRPARYVAVTGAVRAAGRIPYRDGMTLRDALLLAQGVREDASLQEVEIARLPTDRRAGAIAVTIRVPLDSTYLFDRGVDGRYLGPPGEPAAGSGAPEVSLQPYDNVLVLRQPDWELHRTVVITGQVRYPGSYALRTRLDRITDLLDRSGGLTPVANPEGIGFFRAVDAPRPALASGLSGPRGRIGVDLPKVLGDPSFRDNLILADGDSLHIPEYNPVVRVLGAVNAPTGVMHVPGKRVGYYVAAAGGYSRLADKGKTFVEQPSGKLESVTRRFLLPDSEPVPLPGAAVTVPMRDPDDKKDLPGIFGAVASALASAVTIIVVLATR